MITLKDMKPIPKTILRKIQNEDKKHYPSPYGFTRFYAYLAIWKKELVKITVAVKHHKKQWYCKQVAVHGIHAEKCYVKDLEYCYLTGMGFRVGWHAEGLNKTEKWFEDGRWYTANDCAYDPYAKVVNIRVALQFPEYQYSACDVYSGVDIFQYLRLYEKYPQIEFLVKLGLSKYVHSKQILDLITTDKPFRKWLARNRFDLAQNDCYISSILKAYKTGKPLLEIDVVEKAHKKLSKMEGYAQIKQLFKGNIARFLSYINKQGTNIKCYLDYIKACNYLKLDMSQTKNLTPYDFDRWRTIRLDQYCSQQSLSDETLRNELYRQFSDIIKKYAPMENYKNQAYIAYIAHSPAELFREGEFLSHCVGTHGYDQRVVRGESLIFFIRKLDEPNKPFVTVEYSLEQRKILQCQTYNHQIPDEKVLNFVHKKWLPYANKQLQKIAA